MDSVARQRVVRSHAVVGQCNCSVDEQYSLAADEQCSWEQIDAGQQMDIFLYSVAGQEINLVA